MRTPQGKEDWQIKQTEIWKPYSASVSPLALLTLRCCFCLYAISLQVYQLVESGSRPLSFFTIWNFLALEVFFLLGTYESIRSVFGNRGEYYSIDEQTGIAKHIFTEPLIERSGVAFVFLFHVCFSMVFLVDVVYWGVLYPDMPAGRGGDFMSVNQHGVNAFFMFTEFALNRIPWIKWNILPFLLWPLTFTLFAWVYNSITTVWVYKFVDYNTWVAPGWYLGLLVMHILFFSLCGFLIHLKKKWCGPPANTVDRSPSQYGAEFT